MDTGTLGCLSWDSEEGELEQQECLDLQLELWRGGRSTHWLWASRQLSSKRSAAGKLRHSHTKRKPNPQDQQDP